jgi:hypothetical protein
LIGNVHVFSHIIFLTVVSVKEKCKNFEMEPLLFVWNGRGCNNSRDRLMNRSDPYCLRKLFEEPSLTVMVKEARII